MTHPFTRAIGFFGAPLLVACGGIAILDPGDGAGGAGSTTTSTSSSATSSVTSTGTGLVGCTDHADCPGALCIFATSTCAPACIPEACDPCGPGTVCDACATAGAPGDLDCVAACVPTTSGRCDENDPCAAGEVCVYGLGICAKSCDTNVECDGFSFCDGCATGSCCGCDDCVAACMGGE